MFAGTEPLGRIALERMLAGVSTRRYPAAVEPVGEGVETTSASTSKPAVSRRFIAMTETALADLLVKDLRNVKRWRNGQMALRWCAAGMTAASMPFRRVKTASYTRPP